MSESQSSPPPDAWAYNARIGIILFAIYGAFYALFIVLAAFFRDVMKQPAVQGVNLAIIYGFSLIGGAFLLAVIYMLLCHHEPETGPTLTEAELAAKSVEEEGAA